MFFKIPVFFCTFLLFATYLEAAKIREIHIRGAAEIETSQILFSLENQIGETINRKKIIQDIKTIYQLGLFQNIRAEVETAENGYLLNFIVTERPRIIDIQYEGRKSLPESTLEEELTLKKTDIYDPVIVQRNQTLLQDLYRKKGYAQARISHRIEKISEQQYRLYFMIEEAPQIFLTDITIDGAQIFSENEIKRFMISSEIDCFGWVNDSGLFQEERVNQDLALITQNYLKNGYIKVFIPKPQVTLYHNTDYSWLQIKMNIKEGPQYFAGKIDITGDLLGSKKDLLKILELKEGDVYNPFLQNQDRTSLTETYQEQGYAFARIIPQTKINDDSKLVDITYHIIKKEKAYLGRIDFSGNSTTRDFVIRREFEVQEGELYNGKKLRLSRENLERLGFFEAGFPIDQNRHEEEDNILDLLTSLKEAQTGTFQAQLGYSEQSKLSGALSLSKANLFGRGQSISVSLQFAQEGVQNNFSVNFTEPRWLGTHVSAGVFLSLQRIGARAQDAQRERSENVYGGTVGFPLYQRWRIYFRLRAVDRLFSKNNIPAVIKRSVSTSLNYNDVNHPVFPSQGKEFDLTVTQTGTPFGGNTRLREYTSEYQQFWALNTNRTLIAMARGRLGWIEPLGNFDIPQEDRYFIGGITTVRGHETFAIAGPSGINEVERNEKNIDSITETGNIQPTKVDERAENLSQEELRQLHPGGTFQRILNLELLFPLNTDERSNMRGVVFFDAGNVNAESLQYRLLKENEPKFWDVRKSLGIGFRLITPVGVFRFEYGQKLDQLRGESPDKFDFNISGLF